MRGPWARHKRCAVSILGSTLVVVCECFKANLSCGDRLQLCALCIHELDLQPCPTQMEVGRRGLSSYFFFSGPESEHIVDSRTEVGTAIQAALR